MVNSIYENEWPTLLKNGGNKFGKWLFVEDAAEMLVVSKRTIFEYLRDGKISGIKSRGRRLISTASMMGFLLEQKVIEISDFRHKEIARDTLNHLRGKK